MDGLALTEEACSPVRHESLTLSLSDGTTQVSLGIVTEFATPGEEINKFFTNLLKFWIIKI